MRTICATWGLTALLLISAALQANALTVAIDVGPDNIKTLKYRFDFTSKERDGLIQVGITVTPKKEAISPGLLARVHLIGGESKLATIPLEETREDGKVTYWFQIAPGLLAKSRFEFDILSGKEEKLPNGKTRFIAIPGTLEYWFNVRDCVAPVPDRRSSRVGDSH